MKYLPLLVAGAFLGANALAHSPRHPRPPKDPHDRVRVAKAPKIAVERGLRFPRLSELRIIYRAPPLASFPTNCEVDFDDPEAMALIPDHEITFAHAPWWFQNCGGTLGNYAVVRPLQYSHFHLTFEDETIGCVDPGTGVFGRLQDDDTCSSAGVDHVNEPRSVIPHWGDEYIHLYVVNQFVNPNDPYSDSTSDKKPFDLKRLRVIDTPVRVCYKKVQEVDGPWIASPDVHQAGSEPGVWLCWNNLGPGLWDLSAWATHIREAKITSTNGATVFHIDDIRIGVQ